MVDLIDRAALMDALAKRVPYVIDTPDEVAFAQGLDAAYQCVVDAPAVPAARLSARCKECRHSSRIANDTDGMRHCWSLRGRNNGDGFSRVKQDGYCDEGERKEGEHGTN